MILSNGEEALDHAKAWLTEHYPMIAGGLLFNDDTIDATEIAHARRVMDSYLSKVGRDASKLEAGLEAFGRISFDFLRLQSRFNRSGVYQRSEAGPVIESLYLDPEKMTGYYLDGLLLTYALWSNHARMLAFLTDTFLPSLPNTPGSAEIGVGHGLLSLQLLQKRAEGHHLCLDISPSSLDYSAALMAAHDVDSNRYTMGRCDITSKTERQDAGITDGGYDAVLCCEVLEHVEQPQAVLAGIRAMLKSDGRAFITTVANIEAEDHIFLFNNAAHIRAFLAESGLTVKQELALPLSGMEKFDPLPLNYAAIVRPS
jgi:SAM-dependent methyltransferase